MSSNDDLTARIDKALAGSFPFGSIKTPLLALLREAGAALLMQEADLRKVKEERDIAQQLLLEQTSRHDPRASTERGWK